MISIIVGTAQNGVIGKGGRLPWRLPADLARFKTITMGHPIIMGRRTYESIGRPLPGRTNIIITSDISYKADGCLSSGSLEDALAAANRSEGGGETFIIGGESIYSQALPVADKIYLTEVQSRITGDRFFKFDKRQWREVSSEPHSADIQNQYDYIFKELVRKR